MAWTPVRLLEAWESGAGLPPPARTAALLCAEGRTPDADAALDLDLGTAARLAGASLTDSFGPRADLVVTCPACSEVLQADIEVPLDSGQDSEHGPGDVSTPDVSAVEVDGWLVRLPTLRELASVHGLPDAAGRLRSWCVARVRPDAAQPSDERLDDAMSSLAGLGLLDGEVTCPGCGTAFTAGLDLGVLLWDQVRTRAPQILSDVAVLARAYGWSEDSILALSDARRTAYLSLVGGA